MLEEVDLICRMKIKWIMKLEKGDVERCSEMCCTYQSYGNCFISNKLILLYLHKSSSRNNI